MNDLLPEPSSHHWWNKTGSYEINLLLYLTLGLWEVCLTGTDSFNEKANALSKQFRNDKIYMTAYGNYSSDTHADY